MACQSICFSGLFDDKNKMTEEKWIYEVFIFIYTFYFIFFWEGGHSLCPFFYPRNWLKTSPSPTADKAFSKKTPENHTFRFPPVLNWVITLAAVSKLFSAFTSLRCVWAPCKQNTFPPWGRRGGCVNVTPCVPEISSVIFISHLLL